MSDTMPERVWLKSYPGIGPRTAASHEHGAIAYVPEQRALDAERERDVLAHQLERRADGMDDLTQRLRAELDAERTVCATAVQRALDAERELSNMAYEYNMLSSQSAREIDLRERARQLDHITMDALRAERDALQADLKALLPLARLGLLAIDANSYFPVRAIEWGLIDWHRRDTANLTAARAILDAAHKGEG